MELLRLHLTPEEDAPLRERKTYSLVPQACLWGSPHLTPVETAWRRVEGWPLPRRG